VPRIDQECHTEEREREMKEVREVRRDRVREGRMEKKGQWKK
jgi:hypothetical protein